MNNGAESATRRLTSRQHDVLAGIIRFRKETGYYPTVREVMGFMGIAWPNTVYGYLSALERKGFIRRGRSGSSRNIELVGVTFTPSFSEDAAGQMARVMWDGVAQAAALNSLGLGEEGESE